MTNVVNARRMSEMLSRAACELSTRIATAIGVVAGVTRSTSRRTPSSRTTNASVPRPVSGARVFASHALT